MVRIFVGLGLPDAHRQTLAHVSHGLEGARWVAPHNLHMTLRFIGEVDEDVAEDVAVALRDIQSAPFALKLLGLGTFGHPPHALWAGVEDMSGGALRALAANIESVLVREGLAPESRKFTPHVTLARFRKAAMGHAMGRIQAYMEQFGALALDPFDVLGFTLFQSHLRQDGAEYEPIVEYLWPSTGAAPKVG